MSDKMATKSENGFIWLIVECVRVIEASLKLLTNSIELKTSNCIGFFCILSSDAMILICLSAQKAPRILILFTYLFTLFWFFFIFTSVCSGRFYSLVYIFATNKYLFANTKRRGKKYRLQIYSIPLLHQ